MKDWIPPIAVLVAGVSFAFYLTRIPQQVQVCTQTVKVVEIVHVSYRTAYVRLSNGKVVSYYSPDIAPGDDVCLNYEWRTEKH